MAVVRNGEIHPAATRRSRLKGILCIGFVASATWWAAAPAPGSLGAANGAAFAGLVAAPETALAPLATRGLVARAAGRDWRPGNVAKKQDFKGGGPATFGGGKKKKAGKKEEDNKEPPKIYREAPIVYNGEKVGTANGTIAEYKVDIWSGAHPVWQGKKGKVLLDASSVTKFQERFGYAADIYGSTGMEQLEMNKKLKKEQEEREKMGLKAY